MHAGTGSVASFSAAVDGDGTGGEPQVTRGARFSEVRSARR
ncbi:hypothetical protein [Streptomyces sviceus]